MKQESNTTSARHMSLSQAIERYVKDGMSVALEGFTHLIPFAAGHEIIRQQKRQLTLIRMTPDLIYDQMIGMGCARKLVFSWGGNPGVGSLHRFRDAVENDWPGNLQLDEHSHAAMAAAYQAGASNLPFAMLRGYLGCDLPKVNPNISWINCPYTNELLATVPALRPDVTIIHAQQTDLAGNVYLGGIIGVQREAALAAKNVIVTVEEVVEKLDLSLNANVLPHWVISAVCQVSGGATPSYAHGYYERDNAFCKRWDDIARERDTFRQWMETMVLTSSDFAEYQKRVTVHG